MDENNSQDDHFSDDTNEDGDSEYGYAINTRSALMNNLR